MENKNIVLQRMKIHQFKGIQTLEMDFKPGENSLYGANAAGKTTVYDALLWLLFDKDSNGSGKFTVKPINATQGVTPTVTACFLVNGQPLKLQKTLREKWEKHRGGESRFAGDTREYFVDDVPRKETEYKRIIAQYIDETQFKLLTNLYAFARDTHWKDRRALLGEMCSLPSDYEIASGASQFAALLEVLQKSSVVDYKAKLLNERKGIDTKLNTLPIRIDECELQIASLEPLTTLSFQQAKENLCDFQSALQESQAKLAGLDNGAALSQAKNEKRGLETDLRALELGNRQYRAAQKSTADLCKDLQREMFRIDGELEWELKRLEIDDERLQDMQKELQRYRDKWAKIQKEKPAINANCPTCGQALPKEKIEDVIQKFSADKQARLQEVTKDAKQICEQIKKSESAVSQQQKTVSSLKEKRRTLRRKIDEIQNSEPSDVQDLPDYQERKATFTKKLEEIEKTINRLQTDKQSERAALQCSIGELEAKIREAQAVVSKERQLTDMQDRIAELQREQRATAAKLDEIDGAIDLCEAFSQYKANLIEDRVNSRFRLAKFRMFRQLVNGGLEDCCEITVEGVPYPDLNNSMKINVGLDCITALSEHFGVRVPLFIDNAESVTQLLDMPSQRIRLIVSAEDVKLRLA